MFTNRSTILDETKLMPNKQTEHKIDDLLKIYWRISLKQGWLLEDTESYINRRAFQFLHSGFSYFLKLVNWIESSESSRVKMECCECAESGCFDLECIPYSWEHPERWRCNVVKLIFILTASPPVVMTLSDVSQSSVLLFPVLYMKKLPDWPCAVRPFKGCWCNWW